MENKIFDDTITFDILADDSAYAADVLIEMLEKGPVAAKLLFKKNGKTFRAYIDNVNEDNDIGKIVDPKPDFEKIIKGDYSTVIMEYNDCLDSFSIEMQCQKTNSSNTTTTSSIPEHFLKMIDEKINSGVKPELKPILEARVEYMIRNHVHDLDIQDVISYWSVDCLNESGTNIPTYYVDPSLQTTIDQNKNGIISRAIQAYLVGNPKILKGPKSTGKNTMINTIIWLFGDKMEEHTFSNQDSYSDVISSEGTDNSAMERLRTISTSVLANAEKVKIAHSIDPNLPYSKEDDELLLAEALFKQLSAEAGSVHIVHEYRGFARWLLDSTGHTCYVADELNMADANLLVSLLHPILDGSITEFDLPGRGKIPLAKHHMLFGTENVGYAGEQESNSATRSRFGAFELAQPSTISGILHSAVKSGLNKIGITEDLEEKYYEKAEAFYSVCKEAVSGGATSSYSSGELSDQCLNVRGIVRAMIETKRFEGRTTLNQNIEDEVITPCDDEERPMLMRILNKVVNC